jgi:hypothetical protein
MKYQPVRYERERSSLMPVAEAMLGLAAGPPPADFDQGAFAEELASLTAEYRHVSLKELRRAHVPGRRGG